MGEMLAVRESQGKLHDDLDVIDQILDAVGYEGNLDACKAHQYRLVIFASMKCASSSFESFARVRSYRAAIWQNVSAPRKGNITDQCMVMKVTCRISKATDAPA